MTYTWSFNTGDKAINPIGRKCHRGPMIDVEVVMSERFRYMREIDTLRARFLKAVVSTDYYPIQTRETSLRAMNSLMSPVFVRLLPRKEEIQVLICEKRSCVDIEKDLADIRPEFSQAASVLARKGVLGDQVQLILDALESDSPVVRVAGKAALILLSAYMEMDARNA